MPRSAQTDIGFEPLVAQAERFVQQYGYRSPEEILVAFDGPAIESELVRLNEPLWGAERPLTVVWIVVDRGRGRRELMAAPAEESDSALPEEAKPVESELIVEIRDAVTATATERGVPLVFPLLDDQDLDLVSTADVWGGFNDRIEAASRRYQADAVLIGRIRVTGRAFAARWTLLTGDDLRERRGSVRDGVDWLADTYAAQFAVAGGASRRRVTVVDLVSLDDYGRVMSFLENLSLVESVVVEQLAEDRLVLAIDVRGDQQVLERAMSLGGVLRPVPPPALPGLGGDLYFRVARK